MVRISLLLMMGAKCKIDRVEQGLSHGLTCDIELHIRDLLNQN